MTTFNDYTNYEIVSDLEDYFAEDILETPDDEDESQRYTLGFYNWMIGGNSAVVEYYRQFDHCLLNREQAVEAMEDALYDLCDLVEDESGDVVGSFTLDCVSGTAEVPLYIDGDTYTAHIWVERVEVAYVPPVNVIGNDAYWQTAA